LHIVWCVAKFYAVLGAVEHSRRDREITGRGIAISDFTDVGIDAKNLLDHHHGPFGLALGLCDVGRAFESIGGF
jgi:hypothetical protein